MRPIPKFKVTEAGVIPESWGAERLAEVAERIGVGIASAATHAYRVRGVALLRNQNIKPGVLDDSDVLYVDPTYERVFKNKRLKTGDLLTARTGFPGVTCVVPPEFDGAQSFTTLITRPRANRVDASFLAFFINSAGGQAFFERTQIGGAQKNVNAGTLREMPVPVPPLPEQRAIAAALSNVDALIASLDRLIAKKRDLMQASVQQLLTGQTRLPGFGGKWERTTLAALGTFSKGKGIRKEEVREEGLPCLRYGEIYTHHHDIIRSFRSFITRDIAKTSQRLSPGDLVLACSGETADEIGKCVAFVGTEAEEAYVGGDTVILSPKGHDSVFLGYLLNHPAVVAQKARRAQGDAVVHISARNLASIVVWLPKPAEQRAVGGVLADMDRELGALSARRDKTRLLKRGMMQELLTGRTRLV